ncbi:DUF397 domain-containing protein [Longimycelium tulufanense]|uniref:DUF397 domain-containing protein n=1 Tax=Longimycelium tulufanense TaxID=907463 RepID=UPI001E6485EB|nr:DUF397 domain-containing protein [Longimycelium tulufanense]
MASADWRKSSRSGTSNGGGGSQCVEVASAHTVVGVRDSKNPTGPALIFESATWSAFVRQLQRGTLDV